MRTSAGVATGQGQMIIGREDSVTSLTVVDATYYILLKAGNVGVFTSERQHLFTLPAEWNDPNLIATVILIGDKSWNAGFECGERARATKAAGAGVGA